MNLVVELITITFQTFFGLLPLYLSSQMSLIKYAIEKSFFGVCTQLGEAMNISAKSVRLSFVYASFFTLGSPIIFYLVAAFWLNVKKYSQERRTRIWDL